MSAKIISKDELYEGMPLIWEWPIHLSKLDDFIIDRRMRPIGNVISREGIYYIRLTEDNSIEVKSDTLFDAKCVLFYAIHMDFEAEKEPRSITNRLRGIYHIPITDGHDDLKDIPKKGHFTRKFDTTPISHEAAHRIELLEQILQENIENNFNMLVENCTDISDESFENQIENLRASLAALKYDSMQVEEQVIDKIIEHRKHTTEENERNNSL